MAQFSVKDTTNYGYTSAFTKVDETAVQSAKTNVPFQTTFGTCTYDGTDIGIVDSDGKKVWVNYKKFLHALANPI